MVTTIFGGNSFYDLITPFDDRCLEAASRVRVHPQQEFTWGETCSVDQERLEICEISPSIYLQYWHFQKNLNKAFGGRIKEAWRNTYRNGSFQEPHDHTYSDVSAVLFLDDNDKEAGGQFYFRNYSPELGIKWKRIIPNEELHYVDYKKGDIIFFPSYMIHGVTPYKLSFWDDVIKKKRRTTLAFNFEIEHSESIGPYEGSKTQVLFEEALENHLKDTGNL